MSDDKGRRLLLAAIPVAIVIVAFAVAPIAQPLKYHLFADSRGWLGIPNVANVGSNLVFLLTGGLGLIRCLRHRPPGALVSWSVFFGGVALVSVGSALYHWAPDNDALVWDRLPMTIGFMGLYAALLAESVDRRLEKVLLPPAVLLGLGSVAYWHASGDLAAYLAVQALVFLSAVAILLAYEGGLGPKRYLIATFASYGAAVLCEWLDHEVFSLTLGVISGHTIKHLFAGLATFWIVRMLHARG